MFDIRLYPLKVTYRFPPKLANSTRQPKKEQFVLIFISSLTSSERVNADILSYFHFKEVR
jgi:hypothetical protein